MKLTLDATPEELDEKGPDLIKSLAEQLGVDLSVLEKAQRGEKEGMTLKPKALRHLHDEEAKVVQKQYEAMLADIAKVLDQ